MFIYVSRLLTRELATTNARSFGTTLPAFAKPVETRQISKTKKKAIPVPTKKALAAKERKQLAKKRRMKDPLDDEKLPLEEAIRVLRAIEVARPWSTYELTVKTAMGKGTTIPKGRMILPREVKARQKDVIVVFAEGAKADEARSAGATIVGGTELIDGLANGTTKATIILCTPALIRAITPRLGRILGPLGLMPAARRGTVTDDIRGYLRKLEDTSEWRADPSGVIRLPIGKMDFPVQHVAENVLHFMNSAKKATGMLRLPNQAAATAPVNEITKVMLSASQSPGIRISDAL